jgi:hypothetical protein
MRLALGKPTQPVEATVTIAADGGPKQTSS